VIYEGFILGEMPVEGADVDEIGLLMAGRHSNPEVSSRES
jgi:hypothetical protein